MNPIVLMLRCVSLLTLAFFAGILLIKESYIAASILLLAFVAMGIELQLSRLVDKK